jgi:hypothetical protein
VIKNKLEMNSRHCFVSVETCHTLLKRDLRRSLFTLFAGWSGQFGRPLGHASTSQDVEEKRCTELQLSALQAMSALLCCGPCFNPQGLAEDGVLYPWLDMLLASHDDKVGCCLYTTVILFVNITPMFIYLEASFSRWKIML